MEIFNQQDSSFAGLESFCDGRIRTEDGWEFRIHRVVLASESDYFAAVFGSRIQQSKSHVVGVDGQTFAIILNYVYTRDACADSQNIVDLLVAADYLSMEHLLKVCCDSVTQLMSPVNCIQLLHVASVLGHLELYDTCFRYVQTHFSQALSQPESDSPLQDLDLMTLQRLLDSDLNVDSEDIVWDAVVHWISKDPPARSGTTAELLSRIRLQDASADLMRRIATSPFVTQNELCQSLLLTGSGGGHMQQMMRLDSRQPPIRYCRLKAMCTDECVQVDLSFDERLDATEARWFRMGVKEDFHPLQTVAIGGTLYLFNGERTYGFHLTSKTWFDLPPMVEPDRDDYCIVALDNFVYCIGGRPIETFDVERLEHGSQTWTSDVSVREVDTLGMAATWEGRIYYLGVKSERQYDEVNREDKMVLQRYNPMGDSWSLLTPPKVDRGQYFAMIPFDGSLFICGDENEEDYSVERYIIGMDLWTTIKDLPGKYTTACGFVVNGNMIVFDYLTSDCPIIKWVKERNEWQECSSIGDLHNCELLAITDFATNRELRTVLKQGS